MSDFIARAQGRARLPEGKTLLRIAGHAGALLPLALLLWDFWWGQLGADPIRAITLRTGKAAITLLVLSLAVTPLRIWFGWNVFYPLRRILGVYAFLYVVLHLLVFVALDYGLDLILIRDALIETPYVLVGFAAFLIMLPMALTSTRAAMKRLGKRWTQLHRWVYLAAILALLHYFLLVKNAYAQPLLYAGALGVLLLTRVPPVRRTLQRWRRQLAGWLKKQPLGEKR